jgi:arylsulfatase
MLPLGRVNSLTGPAPGRAHTERRALGGGLAKGGLATLFIDGGQVGEGRIDATVPMIYSGDETCDVGHDSGTPVSEDYTSAASAFTGTVHWVQLNAGDDDHDHLISPEDLMRVATSIQWTDGTE